MLEIPVELGVRRYVISVGHGLAQRLPELLSRLGSRRTVVDGRTLRTYRATAAGRRALETARAALRELANEVLE